MRDVTKSTEFTNNQNAEKHNSNSCGGYISVALGSKRIMSPSPLKLSSHALNIQSELSCCYTAMH